MMLIRTEAVGLVHLDTLAGVLSVLLEEVGEREREENGDAEFVGTWQRITAKGIVSGRR